MSEVFKVLPDQHLLNHLFEYSDGVLVRRITVNGRAKAGDVVSGTVKGYVRVTVRKTQYLVHRLIYVMKYGQIPDGMEIDHVDGNRSNNRIENLRLVTSRENSFNLRKIEGFSFSKEKGKFRATIRKDGRTKHLGYFGTSDEARCAYVTAKSTYHIIEQRN